MLRHIVRHNRADTASGREFFATRMVNNINHSVNPFSELKSSVK